MQLPDQEQSGRKGVIALPEDVEDESDVNHLSSLNGPRLDYRLYVTTPGTYSVWVRLMGNGSKNDSVHVGINGEAVTTEAGMGISSRGKFRWKNNVLRGVKKVTVKISKRGYHIFNLWMREDGVIVDKILLLSNGLKPTELGPPEVRIKRQN